MNPQSSPEKTPDQTPDQTPDPKRRWVLWGLPLCGLMGVWEFNRALGGNHLSWVYVIEWPFFGVFIYYMYWKLSQPQAPYDDSEDPPRQVL